MVNCLNGIQRSKNYIHLCYLLCMITTKVLTLEWQSVISIFCCTIACTQFLTVSTQPVIVLNDVYYWYHDWSTFVNIRTITYLFLFLTLNVTGCTKSHDKIKYCIITFKIELRRNFSFIYSFFIPRCISRLFYTLRIGWPITDLPVGFYACDEVPCGSVTD